MTAISAASSSGLVGFMRCVDRSAPEHGMQAVQRRRIWQPQAPHMHGDERS